MSDLVNKYYLSLLRVKQVGIHGIEYRRGCLLRLQEMDELGNDYPVYGQVDKIIVWKYDKIFILTEIEIISFHNHFKVYEVERTDNRALSCARIYHGMDCVAYCSEKWEEIYCEERRFLYRRHTLKEEFFSCYILPLLTSIYDVNYA